MITLLVCSYILGILASTIFIVRAFKLTGDFDSDSKDPIDPIVFFGLLMGLIFPFFWLLYFLGKIARYGIKLKK